MNIGGCAYLSGLFYPDIFESTLHWCISTLRNHETEFDAIAFRGMSGALIVPSVAMALGKQMILVRKDGERCHSKATIEGVSEGDCRYVILDDCVSSGVTVQTIQKKIYAVNPRAKCVGIALYFCEEYYPLPPGEPLNNWLWWAPLNPSPVGEILATKA